MDSFEIAALFIRLGVEGKSATVLKLYFFFVLWIPSFVVLVLGEKRQKWLSKKSGATLNNVLI